MCCFRNMGAEASKCAHLTPKNGHPWSKWFSYCILLHTSPLFGFITRFLEYLSPRHIEGNVPLLRPLNSALLTVDAQEGIRWTLSSNNLTKHSVYWSNYRHMGLYNWLMWNEKNHDHSFPTIGRKIAYLQIQHFPLPNLFTHGSYCRRPLTLPPGPMVHHGCGQQPAIHRHDCTKWLTSTSKLPKKLHDPPKVSLVSGPFSQETPNCAWRSAVTGGTPRLGWPRGQAPHGSRWGRARSGSPRWRASTSGACDIVGCFRMVWLRWFEDVWRCLKHHSNIYIYIYNPH